MGHIPREKLQYQIFATEGSLTNAMIQHFKSFAFPLATTCQLKTQTQSIYIQLLLYINKKHIFAAFVVIDAAASVKDLLKGHKMWTPDKRLCESWE